LLEAPDAPDNWYSHILGQDWTNKGSIVERAQLTDLITELAAQPVQLLIGIRAQQTPDRGIVRQISKLAQAAQHFGAHGAFGKGFDVFYKLVACVNIYACIAVA